MGILRLSRRGTWHIASGIAAFWLSAFAPRAVLAAPITLLDVTGDGGTGQIIGVDQAAAVSFSLDSAYTDVAISADLICIGCSGEIFVMQGQIGPTATLANFVTGAVFNTSSSVDPLLSGLSLAAGDYFVIVAVTNTGGAGWTASDPFTLTTATGVTMGLNYFAGDLDDSVAFRSAFSPIASSAALHFSVTASGTDDGGSGGGGGGSDVPEPAGLMILALGPLLWRVSRRASVRQS